jgi:hypothetical protein
VRSPLYDYVIVWLWHGFRSWLTSTVSQSLPSSTIEEYTASTSARSHGTLHIGRLARSNFQKCLDVLGHLEQYWAGARYLRTGLDQKGQGINQVSLDRFEDQGQDQDQGQGQGQDTIRGGDRQQTQDQGQARGQGQGQGQVSMQSQSVGGQGSQDLGIDSQGLPDQVTQWLAEAYTHDNGDLDCKSRRYDGALAVQVSGHVC